MGPFAELVREHRAEWVALARRHGLLAEDAFDCVHDALCVFHQRALRGELPATASEQASLVAGIVVNTARNQRRLHHRARPHAALEEMAGDDAATDLLLAHAEDCARLHACVGKLCDKQRSVVTMRMLEERSGEDVARALGLSRAYVDVLLNRAKASLRVCVLGER